MNFSIITYLITAQKKLSPKNRKELNSSAKARK